MEVVKLQDLAQRVAGIVIGDPQVSCLNAVPLRDAGAGDVTFVEDETGLNKACIAGVAAVVIKAANLAYPIAQLVVPEPRKAFASIVEVFRPQRIDGTHGISPLSQIAPSSSLGTDTVVYPGVYIGENVTIGNRCVIYPGVQIMHDCSLRDDVVLFPNVVLYANTIIEDRVLIHAGSVIGAYGFGYELREGAHHRTAQLGYVHLESDVEIGACVTIDRGTFGSTRIGQGTKIDNQVMIGHNCKIGKHNLICAQAGIAGSCVTGDYCVLAGQVGLADHLEIGDKVTIGAQSGVMHNLQSGTYLGSPAIPIREQMHLLAAMRKLPEMHKSLRKLEAIVASQGKGSRVNEASGPASSGPANSGDVSIGSKKEAA